MYCIAIPKTLTIEHILVGRRHQEEEIKGHDHSFSSNRWLYHLFNHLLALEMMGALLQKFLAKASPRGTEWLTRDGIIKTLMIYLLVRRRGNGRVHYL
jgi:hypothetical protein